MSKSTTGADLIADIANRTGYTKRAVKDLLEVISQVVADGISEGKTVTVPGVVRIGTRVRAERRVRNPSNGVTSIKPAHSVLKITGLKPMRDAIPD